MKAAADGGPHSGTFTELSVTATPGSQHSFSAKADTSGGTHTGFFTELSVMAVPGRVHSFSAKGGVVPTPPPVQRPGGSGGGHGPLTRWPDPDKEKFVRDELRRKRILKEDDELMELAALIVSSGILD